MKLLSIYLTLGCLAILSFYFLFNHFSLKPTSLASTALLNNAFENYKKGEQATTIQDRKVAFNQALHAYLILEEQFPLENSNGLLYYNLGNLNYELGEYAQAIFYYYKSLKLNPSHRDSQQNLKQTLNQLHLSLENPSASFTEKIFFFQHWLSLPQRFELFYLFLGISFLLASLLLWQPFRILSFLLVLSCSLLIFLGIHLFYAHYLLPLEGVLIHAAPLYRDAGFHYAKVSNQPLAPGLKVEILDIKEQGQWLKVLAPDGKLGFVSHDTIKAL